MFGGQWRQWCSLSMVVETAAVCLKQSVVATGVQSLPTLPAMLSSVWRSVEAVVQSVDGGGGDCCGVYEAVGGGDSRRRC